MSTPPTTTPALPALIAPHRDSTPLPFANPPPPANSTPAPVPFQPIFTLITPSALSTTAAVPAAPTYVHPAVHYIFADDDEITPEPTPGTRTLTVDLDATGTRVLSAHSLSPDFQLVSAELGVAPRLREGQQGGLMLAMQGVEGGLRGVKAGGGVEGLAEVFHERMAMLKRVVEFGEGCGGGSESTMPGGHVVEAQHGGEGHHIHEQDPMPHGAEGEQPPYQFQPQQ
ncbi:hypothetical protein EDC01DRAFT_469585 [Geopyxis carbonaria]|nr:hypothetical protein EDC01DRAFT_469585 [Geopyxis carbonaria]